MSALSDALGKARESSRVVDYELGTPGGTYGGIYPEIADALNDLRVLVQALDAAPDVDEIRKRLVGIMTGASQEKTANDMLGEVFGVVEYIDQKTKPEEPIDTDAVAQRSEELAAAFKAEYPKLTVWIEEQMAKHRASLDHQPVQHRDGKPPWCSVCGLTANGSVPVSRFDRKGD